MSIIIMGVSAAKTRKYCGHCNFWAGVREFHPNKTISWDQSSKGKCIKSGSPCFNSMSLATSNCTKFELWSILSL